MGLLKGRGALSATGEPGIQVSPGIYCLLSRFDPAFDGDVAECLRPIMMTVCSIIAGLLPIMWGSGTGSEVMRRIAAPMVGGMISVTLLSLIVIPALYALVKVREIKPFNDAKH